MRDVMEMIDDSINVEEIEDTTHPEPWMGVFEMLRKERLNEVLLTLNAQEQKTLRDRFFNKSTLKTIGHELGVGTERVRQIEAHAFRKLRQPIRLRKLEDLY